MLSPKMKVKKVIFLIISSLTCFMQAGIVQHTMISITEQKMLGHVFKHVMTSGAAGKDEFYIDGHMVSSEDYHKEFDRAQKKEWDEHVVQQENQRRSRLQFSEMIQVEITAKLLNNVVNKIVDILDHVYNPVLEKFFVWNDLTVESVDQLNQLKLFVEQVKHSMKKRVENNDIESLHMLYVKLENWPTRLEKFYQSTVQRAIRQSDDTTVLKELLTLVSDPFGAE